MKKRNQTEILLIGIALGFGGKSCADKLIKQLDKK